jgi:hypothetical protein
VGSSARRTWRRRGLPERLLLPPPPRDPVLAERYAQLPFERRRALAGAVRRGGPVAGSAHDRALVRGLADARIATRSRLYVGALVLGWLVWMTVFGVGRTSLPGPEQRWLWIGLAAGVVVAVPAVVSAHRRVLRARSVVTGMQVRPGGRP